MGTVPGSNGDSPRQLKMGTVPRHASCPSPRLLAMSLAKRAPAILGKCWQGGEKFCWNRHGIETLRPIKGFKN
jgi:hypothetical protein